MRRWWSAPPGRRKTENGLRSGLEGANLAERILDCAGDAVIFADGAGTIRRFNPAAEALFGYSAEEALGQSLDLIIPEHLRAAHWRGFDAAMNRATLKLGGRPILTRALHRSGRKLYVEVTFAIVDGAEPPGAVAVARDLTERLERERMAARSAAHAGIGANGQRQ